jgi:sugar phosphate isomerase/epimerase
MGTGDAVPKFYAFCVGEGVSGLQPRPLEEQVKLLGELGYDGAGFQLWPAAEVDRNLQVFDQAGLKPYLLWTSVNVNAAAGPAYDAKVPQAIRKLTGRPTTVCVLLTGLKPGDTNGLDFGVKALRDLGDAAAEAGVRVSIYNHVANWTERLPFILEVVRRADHPRVGYNFNLCHWLKTEGAADYRPLLRAHAPKLFCVTLCGATVGAETWTNGLIQPLDKGDFDNRALLAVLREIGYQGPIGLMCYGVPGDAREHLTRSMKVWRQIQPTADSAK